MAQNKRTIQFWEDYHKENESKEWILQPSANLSEIILQQCYVKSSPDLKLLEIGCGTSTMARDLWNHIVTNQDNGENRKIVMIATDVSPACIQFNKDRDASILKMNYPKGNMLEYRTLDVINPPKEVSKSFSFDVVLDKGCLDTFLFRSRNRGVNNSYSTMLQTLLDNVWSWLRDDGVYLIISPRAKIKAVRDYSGFRSVERHELSTVSRGDLVIQRKNVRPGYIHICRKNPEYAIGETPAFERVFNEDNIPSDSAECLKCGITFVDLRKGEDVEGRGNMFWIRRWRGHCQHCKPCIQG